MFWEPLLFYRDYYFERKTELCNAQSLSQTEHIWTFNQYKQ